MFLATGHDLQVTEGLPRPEENGMTQAKKNRRLNDQMKSLGADLAASKDETRVTRNDILYYQNVAQGCDIKL